MLRLRLNDTTLASELEGFLRRCECVVEQLEPMLLSVGIAHEIDIATAVRQLQDGNCVKCGSAIESCVYLLGSPLCLECRCESLSTAGGGESEVREAWGRMEVEAYVKVWQALHPDSYVELVA
jgi:hypothetical protein